MYAARLVLVFLLILVAVAVSTPQVRGQAVKTWETVKPTVVGLTDSLYIALHDLVTGSGPHNRTDQTPAPRPGGNFQRIVTLHDSFTL